MFEKEAKAYKEIVMKEYLQNPFPRSVEDVWQDGAEFGYNKAIEWHNLEENPTDLPKENMKQVIVGLSDGSYVMGYYCIHDKSWWTTNDCPDYDDELGYYDCNTGEKIYPIKWKEII